MIGHYEMTETLRDLILKRLRENGDWMSRNDLAVALNRKTRLNPYDVEILADLIKSDEIEATQRVIAGELRKEWIYRAKA